MADRKISALTALSTPADGDYIPIVDISDTADLNKRILWSVINSKIVPANMVTKTGTPVANYYAKFTDVDTVEGRSYSEVKTDLSLGNVEDTALSTWVGTTNITTLGTVATGVWSGTAVAVNKGGTGETSYTNGQLLIGNTSGNTLVKATLTGGTAIDVVNGGGTVTINADTATTSTRGVSELATISETSAGQDTGKTISPDGLGGSIYGTKTVIIKIIADATALVTGNAQGTFIVPTEMNGMDLVDVEAHVYTASSSGLPTIQISNITDTADMLSTEITIDENEIDSITAVAPPVIDAGNDDVASADIIGIDVDVAGTGTKGLEVRLSFRIP